MLGCEGFVRVRAFDRLYKQNRLFLQYNLIIPRYAFEDIIRSIN